MRGILFARVLQLPGGGMRALGELLISGGHKLIERLIVKDDPYEIEPLVHRLADPEELDAILITGGTGIAERDQTFETISGLLTKTMPGYGELFRMLSYDEISPAAMLSRAVGGVRGRVVILTMPGSTAAVELAMKKLIVPEIGHLVFEARK